MILPLRCSLREIKHIPKHGSGADLVELGVVGGVAIPALLVAADQPPAAVVVLLPVRQHLPVPGPVGLQPRTRARLIAIREWTALHARARARAGPVTSSCVWTCPPHSHFPQHRFAGTQSSTASKSTTCATVA